MRKLIITGIAALAIAALAFAASAGAGGAKLVVVMKDPGCHWFQVGGKYKTAVTRHGTVTLVEGGSGARFVVTLPAAESLLHETLRSAEPDLHVRGAR